MNDLFPAQINPNAFRSARLRTHLVIGDGMSPTLRSNYDFVIIKPVDRYIGEGIYLLGEGNWDGCVRVQKAYTPVRGVRLMYDNKVYSDVLMTMDEFNERALGIVVAIIKVQREDLIREAA